MDDTKEPALSFQSILKYLSTLQPETIQSDAERSEVLEALAAAQSRLETPWETARKICLIQVIPTESEVVITYERLY